MSFDFEADLRFPAQADDWLESLVIGTVLLLFSGLLLPLIPLQGYLLNCARAGMARDETLPSFTDWERLVGDGLRGLVVLVVYQLPPLLVGAVSFAALLLLGSDNQSLATAGLVVFGLGLLAAVLLTLVAGYLGLIGLLAYAAEDDLRAAFDLGTLRAVGLDGDYAIHWGYGILLVFLLNALFGLALFFVNLVAIVPIIGWLIALLAFVVLAPVGTALSFYAQQVVFRVWGRGYAVSRDLDAGDVPARVGSNSTPTAVATRESDVTASATSDLREPTPNGEDAGVDEQTERGPEMDKSGGLESEDDGREEDDRRKSDDRRTDDWR